MYDSSFLGNCRNRTTDLALARTEEAIGSSKSFCPMHFMQHKFRGQKSYHFDGNYKRIYMKPIY